MTATIVDITQATSRRHARNEQPAAPTDAPRLRWRAIVRTGGQFAASREGDRVEWHLASCSDPDHASAHCSQGQDLISTRGEPGGHCMIDGVCGVCGERFVSLAAA